MRLNTKKVTTEFTHEGAAAVSYLSDEQKLRRSVLSCLLWERQFYEDGQDIAGRIFALAQNCPPTVVANLAREARSTFNLRHAPLLLLVALAKTGSGSSVVSEAIADTIQRADELTEFLAIYWALNERQPQGARKLSAQVKKGLAKAFTKFDAYQLAKYDRANDIRLRDVMFLVHPKPVDDEQAATWRKLVDGSLAAPDTWEVALSGGADKKEAFTRLLAESKLGYLALLRNLRNMTETGVDTGLIRDALLARRGAKRVLPFRYVAAARACPQLEPVIDQALSEAISEMPPLFGKTIILVDVSASMHDSLSARSDMTRMDAAAALASVVHGDVRVFTFSAGNIRYWGDRWDGQNILVEVPPRRGMAGVDAVIRSQEHGGTMLGQAIREANVMAHDRLIVVTDEQSKDPVPDPVAERAYMINVASYQNGIGYGKWTHIDGFSESVLRFINEHEAARTA